MAAEIAQLRALAEEAARAGGAELLAWRGRFQAYEKGRHDLVTDADLASQQAIRGVIAAAFPDHGFYGEESASDDQWRRPTVWLVDPLDGTTNYVHGYACYATSVAAVREGRLLAAAVYDPERDECFTAGALEGATLNSEPLRTSSIRTVDDALLAVSLPAGVTGQSLDLQQFLRLAPLCQGIRRTGSAALNLAYVACGRFDGHWAHEIHPWDAAAGVLLVLEAGGVATASNGGPFDPRRADYLTAATAELHEKLLALVGR